MVEFRLKFDQGVFEPTESAFAFTLPTARVTQQESPLTALIHFFSKMVMEWKVKQ